MDVGERGGWCLTGTVSFQDDENVLEMDSGDGRTTSQVYSMSLNCTLKNG